MSKQPEALRLAERCDGLASIADAYDPDAYREAAAELRRLHAEHVEDQNVIAVWRGRAMRAEQQRDELLEALRWIERRCPAQFLKQEPHVIHTEAAHDAGACARAAIAKTECK